MGNRVPSRAGVPRTAEKGSVQNEYVCASMDRHLTSGRDYHIYTVGWGGPGRDVTSDSILGLLYIQTRRDRLLKRRFHRMVNDIVESIRSSC